MLTPIDHLFCWPLVNPNFYWCSILGSTILLSSNLLSQIFFLLGLFQQGLLEAKYNRSDPIVSRLRIANHEIPPGKQFPRKYTFVFFLRQLRHTRVLCHSANQNVIVGNSELKNLLEIKKTWFLQLKFLKAQSWNLSQL